MDLWMEGRSERKQKKLSRKGVWGERRDGSKKETLSLSDFHILGSIFIIFSSSSKVCWKYIQIIFQLTLHFAQ